MSVNVERKGLKKRRGWGRGYLLMHRRGGLVEQNGNPNVNLPAWLKNQ